MFLFFSITFYFYGNSVLVGVQEYSVTFFLPNIVYTIFSVHTDNVFLGKVVKF